MQRLFPPCVTGPLLHMNDVRPRESKQRSANINIAGSGEQQ